MFGSGNQGLAPRTFSVNRALWLQEKFPSEKLEVICAFRSSVSRFEAPGNSSFRSTDLASYEIRPFHVTLLYQRASPVGRKSVIGVRFSVIDGNVVIVCSCVRYCWRFAPMFSVPQSKRRLRDAFEPIVRSSWRGSNEYCSRNSADV